MALRGGRALSRTAYARGHARRPRQGGRALRGRVLCRRMAADAVEPRGGNRVLQERGVDLPEGLRRVHRRAGRAEADRAVGGATRISAVGWAERGLVRASPPKERRPRGLRYLMRTNHV